MKTSPKPPLAFILAGASALVFVAEAKAQPKLVLTQADNGSTVIVSAGQAIEVDLRANPSTPISWVLSSTNFGAVLTNGPAVFTPDQPGLPGSGGTNAYPFIAAEPGDTTLQFDYLPLGGGPAVQTFTVTLHVVGPALSISLLGTNLVLSWPVFGSTNFFLEGSPGLAPPQWAALNVLPLSDGTRYNVTLGAEGIALYFRLHRR